MRRVGQDWPLHAPISDSEESQSRGVSNCKIITERPSKALPGTEINLRCDWGPAPADLASCASDSL